jgi:hypothetical protein
MLVLSKTSTSASFRAIVKMLLIIRITLSWEGRTPCHNTLRLWIEKIGYYEITREKEKYNDWVVIIDGSIQFGKEKVYVIYGISKSKIPKDRALKISDLTTLYLEIKESWTGETIKEALCGLGIGVENIIFAVSDDGSDIKKGLRLAGIVQIGDVTHRLAIITKKIFENDENYKSISKEISEMRNNLAQTEAAHLVPPAQRKKSHYQNIKTIADWLKNFYCFVEKKKYNKTLKSRKKSFLWILKYKTFIEDFTAINRIICNLEEILKTKGLSLKTKAECLKLFQNSKNSYTKTLRTEFIKYADEMLSRTKYENILCTSDIIESAFGKYKNYVSDNPIAGVTNLVLSLAAFTSDLSTDGIKKALEVTKVQDIKTWTLKNLSSSLFEKRIHAFNFT